MKFPALAILFSICAASVGAAADQDSTVYGMPDYAGRQLRFTSPVDGQEVAAGDSLVVSLSVADSCDIDLILVVVPGGIFTLYDPFKETIKIGESEIGEISFSALGKTKSGEMVASYDIAIEVVSREELLEIFPTYHSERIYGVGCTSSLNIYGKYANGIKRDITKQGTSYTVMDGSEIVCVTADGIVVGRKPGMAVVLVAHGHHKLEVPYTVGEEDCHNNTPQAHLPSLIECELGKETCLDASQVRDFDECIGEEIDPNLIHWKVELESGISEGRGYEFCFLPEHVGNGLVWLEVFDSHGASSKTFSMIEVQ